MTDIVSNLFFQILFFPGFLFILILTFLLEHIASKITNRFYSSNQKAPMFIPIVEQFRLIIRGEKEKFSFRLILQGFILLLMVALPLFGSLILPISIYGEDLLPGPVYGGVNPKYSGVIGIINFEGDILLIFAIITIFNVLVFLVQMLEKDRSIKDSLSVTVKFMLFDIPLFIALGSPILVEKSLSLGVIAEDIRWVVSKNLVFGFLLLIPFSTFVAIFALTLKFDQSYFDRFSKDDVVGIQSPVKRNWKLAVWNLSVSLMEFLIIGLIVMICLGGPHIPIPTSKNNSFIGYSLNFIFKCILVIGITSIIKAVRPRLKMNQAINYSFKFLTPLALGTLLIVGILLAVQVIN